MTRGTQSLLMTTWQRSWTRPMFDARAFQQSTEDVTIRIRLASGSGGTGVRLQLSNRFGLDSLRIGRCVLTLGAQAHAVTFGGRDGALVPAGGSAWSDPLEVVIRPGGPLVVDLYLPEATPHHTANFAAIPVELSLPGDHAGARDFPAVATPVRLAPDGSAMAIPTPFLSAVDVAGAGAAAVVACLGDSITAGSWPELAAALLRAKHDIAMLDLGIAGNRLLTDSTGDIASFGRSGRTRFDDDVLAAAGVTDVIIALGTNDMGLPGTDVPLHELPSVDQLVAAYEELTARSDAAGLRVHVATITPFLPAEGHDAALDRLREEVNGWIRERAARSIDFDAAVRSRGTPTQLATEYDSGDHLHPNDAGQRRLAQVAAEAITACLESGSSA